jgi:hypothetical protein
MASDGTSLYVGTLDGSFLTQFVPALQPTFLHEVGFDLLRSEDGIYWHPVSRFGLGVPTQVAVTSLEGTPLGLVVGTGGIGGAQVWRAGSAPPAGPVAAPYRVESASAVLTNDEVVLSWEPEADAVLYAVYRSEVTPLREMLGGGAPSPLPGGGASSFLCDAAPELCLAFEQFGTNVGLPGPFELAAVTTDLYYVEAPPTSLQSMYFVRAMRADGGLSGPSNVVGAASTAEPVTYPVLERELLALLETGEPTLAKLRALTLVRRSSYSVSGGNMPAGRRMLELGELLVERERGVGIAETEADDICFMFYRLRRNLQLAEWLLIPVASLQ